MKPAPFAYHAPTTLADAVALLSSLDNPRLLAGGQSLMPMLNYRLAAPDHLIDLGRIEALRGIAIASSGLQIGSMTTQRTIQNSPLVAAHCPLLIQALDNVGHQTTRNRGTIGGSLCHLDPAAELPLAAQVLQPMLTIAGRSGERTMPYAEFPLGQLSNTLAADEILVRLTFPPAPVGAKTAFAEFARRPGDFAIVAVAVLIVPGGEARIAVAGIEPVAVRLGEVEAFLQGGDLTAGRIEAAAALVAARQAEGDHNNPADYRRHLAGVLAKRALMRVMDAHS
jgi:aerobic carbon-monoxide dehydrogenase medium subunit